MRRLTARFSPSFSMPKTARARIQGNCTSTGLQKEPPEGVTDPEEDQDHHGHHQGDQTDHRPEAGSFTLVHARNPRMPRLARAKPGMVRMTCSEGRGAGVGRLAYQ